MKFIFPQNYFFKNKLFGFIDYQIVIFNILWGAFIFCLLNFFSISLSIKIFLFILFCFPLFMFSIVGFNHENILYVLFYIYSYIKKPKVYLYGNN